jgi:hypothetical protein
MGSKLHTRGATGLLFFKVAPALTASGTPNTVGIDARRCEGDSNADPAVHRGVHSSHEMHVAQLLSQVQYPAFPVELPQRMQ